MIVSHQHRFIFLKTQKTAGTSIEFALSALCGPDDILTPTMPLEEEHLRLGRREQNYLRGGSEYRRKTRADGILMPNSSVDFFNHLPADKAKEYLGDAVWDGYFKFAFVRNPWDREVSRYVFDRSKKNWPYGDADFRTYFLGLEQPRNTTWGIIALGGKVSVDFVGRYERIEEDFRAALDRIGWREALPIPRAKAGHRTAAERDYRPYYDAETHARIMDWYGDEIRAFGYTFEPA